jgi:hypothetical protein
LFFSSKSDAPNKDKKDKKKHSANGSKKQDHIEYVLTPMNYQVVSTVPPDQQIPIDKKSYEKELALLHG